MLIIIVTNEYILFINVINTCFSNIRVSLKLLKVTKKEKMLLKSLTPLFILCKLCA